MVRSDGFYHGSPDWLWSVVCGLWFLSWKPIIQTHNSEPLPGYMYVQGHFVGTQLPLLVNIDSYYTVWCVMNLAAGNA